jgi:hypothetical protein
MTYDIFILELIEIIILKAFSAQIHGKIWLRHPQSHEKEWHYN